MLLRLLLATVLLLSTLGCAKKTDPTLSPTAAHRTGSYILDGRVVYCTATAFAETQQNHSSLPGDQLMLELTTVPQPADGIETLELVFQKPSGAANTAYKLDRAVLFQRGFVGSQQIGLGYAPNAWELTASSSGGFSGTFSAGSGGVPGGPPSSVIRQGIFTDTPL